MAVKQLIGINAGELLSEILDEAGILACLRNPYIVLFFGISRGAAGMQGLCLVTELCDGSLEDIIAQERKSNTNTTNTRMTLSASEVWAILLQVCSGCQYLQSHEIIHRDLVIINIKAISHESFA